VNGFHHAFESGIEQLASILRITVRQQFHRPLEVGEEDGHPLALAFEALARSAKERSATVLAELRTRCAGAAAGRADPRQACYTLSTEPVLRGILGVAPWTSLSRSDGGHELTAAHSLLGEVRQLSLHHVVLS